MSLEREFEKIYLKTKIWEKANKSCMECSKTVFDIATNVFLKKEKVLCKECSQEQLDHLKSKFTKEDVNRYLDINFDDAYNLTKAEKLGIIKFPVKSTKEFFSAIEEAKKFLTTKELVEHFGLNGYHTNNILERMEAEGIIKPIGRIEIDIREVKKETKVYDIRQIDEDKVLQYIAYDKQRGLLTEKGISLRKKRLKRIERKLNEFNPVLNLLFYAYHISKLAKTPKYSAYKEILYRRKNEAIKQAYLISPEIFNIKISKPINRVILCSDCLKKAFEKWKTKSGKKDIKKFISWKSKKVKPCPKCHIEEDYYSFVFFNFITPVAKGTLISKYWEVKDILEKKPEDILRQKISESFSVKEDTYFIQLDDLIATLKESLHYVNKSILGVRI